ncbi:hypothetical protein D0Y65_050980 [Glycine soja]|uniref:Uncharacterized protein n=1 Tax=Glycine soja TaxID=3848 RepID=A0A445FE85_GLYSO|nr:hypothetical protein D0Y65_050980 [Glycine soja]
MGLTNFVLTVAGVSAVVLLLRSDVKQSASIFRRNVKHIRNWLEEESAASSKTRRESGELMASGNTHLFSANVDDDLDGDDASGACNCNRFSILVGTPICSLQM